MFPEKTGGVVAAPMEIGTKGTVGNLMRKEIEYFKNLDSEVVSVAVSDKTHGGGGGGGSNFGFMKITWPRMKEGGGGGGGDKFLPRVCMTVDVADNHRRRRRNHHHAKEISGFNYRNLDKQYKL